MRKTRETSGELRLLVIGSYRMGFTIAALGHRSRLVVFIDYQLPPSGFTHGLALLLGRTYAAWCTRQMTADAVAPFGGNAALMKRAPRSDQRLATTAGMLAV